MGRSGRAGRHGGDVMRLSRLIAGVALSVAAAQAPAQGLDPGFGGGARVRITLADLDDQPLARPVAGTPFRILVRLRDPASERPVTDEHLSGWIRPVERSNGECRDAARANTLAGDNLPRGTTDLGRSLFGVRHDDGTVSIVDWEHSLASANMLAMVRMPRMPKAITALPDDFGFVLTDEAGARVALDAAAGTEPRPLPDMGGTGAVLVTPDGWMAQGDRLIGPDRASFTLPAPVTALRPALFDADLGRFMGVAVLTRGGMGFVADGAGLSPPVQGPPDATDIAHLPDARAMFFADGSDRLSVVYGTDRRITAPLPAPADRISASPEGDLALAWSWQSGALSVVDVATAQVVQAVHLNRPPLDQPLREVAFAEGAAFLALRDLDFVVVLDLEQARRGTPAAARPVRIGPKVADLPPDAGPFLIQTTRGHASQTVLALHPGLSTAFPVKRDSGNATAPMNGFRIRGARPLGMAELSAGLTETAPGDYHAATVLAQGGPHELIVSAGPGRFTACMRVEVQGPVQSQLVLQLAAHDGGALQDGRAIDLRLLDGRGTALDWPTHMPLILQSLQSGWRAQVVAQPQPQGGHRAIVVDLPRGIVSIALDQSLPRDLAINPTTFEVTP